MCLISKEETENSHLKNKEECKYFNEVEIDFSYINFNIIILLK